MSRYIKSFILLLVPPTAFFVCLYGVGFLEITDEKYWNLDNKVYEYPELRPKIKKALENNYISIKEYNEIIGIIKKPQTKKEQLMENVK